jgi:subtilisin family serine protease
MAFSLVACSESGGAPVDHPEIEKTEQALAGDANYLVVYSLVATPFTASFDVPLSGGRLIATYPYGVVVASSSDPNFASKMSRKRGVQSVALSGGAAVDVNPSFNLYNPFKFLANPAPAYNGAEELASLQWNMDMIRAKQARGVTRGKRTVVVGVMDSGIDITQSDLVGQVDKDRSVTCVGGAVNTDSSNWSNDFFGHGTHVSGVIAAKDDGKGVVGVAPGVSLAAIKVVDDSGMIYPEAFMCGLHWAATHNTPLVNASLTVDPFFTYCPDDPQSATIITAVSRAVADASKRGTTLIAATGNSGTDLAADSCKVLPVGTAGVIGVSSVGPTKSLAYYSDYGFKYADVAAPGGDDSFGAPAVAQVLSNLPVNSYYYWAAADWQGRYGTGCPDGLDLNADMPEFGESLAASACQRTYGFLEGTSQATPHVTGALALAISKYGNQSTSDLLNLLATRSTTTSCAGLSGVTCTSDGNYNGVYGYGILDAYRLVGGQ